MTAIYFKFNNKQKVKFKQNGIDYVGTIVSMIRGIDSNRYEIVEEPKVTHINDLFCIDEDWINEID